MMAEDLPKRRVEINRKKISFKAVVKIIIFIVVVIISPDSFLSFIFSFSLVNISSQLFLIGFLLFLSPSVFLINDQWTNNVFLSFWSFLHLPWTTTQHQYVKDQRLYIKTTSARYERSSWMGPVSVCAAMSLLSVA